MPWPPGRGFFIYFSIVYDKVPYLSKVFEDKYNQLILSKSNK